MISNETIIEALNIIKEICMKYTSCRDCPFYVDRCMIQNYEPDEWRIAEPPKNWKAFF